MTTERPNEGLEATQPFTTEDIAPTADVPAAVTDDALAPSPADGWAAAPPDAGPVTPELGGSDRRGGTRWGIALGVVAVAIGVAAAAAFLLTGQSAASRLAGWSPAGAAVYAEARLDLPGEQRAQVGSFLAHFPGFSDQAILDTKIDEALDRIVSGATEGRQDFSTKIKPWFDGQVAIAAEATSDTAAGGSGLALVAVSDVAGARAWFEALAAEGGVSLTAEDYNGTTLLVGPDDSGAAAFLDGVMLLGDPASVRAAVDTKGASALAKAPGFAAARAALPADQLAFAFVDLDAAMALADAAAGLAAGDLTTNPAIAGLVPDWVAFGVRTDGTGLLMEAAWPHIDGVGFNATNRAGRLANLVPATTVLLTDARDIGSVIKAAVAQVKEDPTAAESLAQLEQAASVLGGLDAVVGWIGDVGLVVTSDGAKIDGGLVIVPADQAAADRLVTQLTGFLDLFGSGSGITVSTEDHDGVPITIVDLGSAEDLLGSALDAGGLGVLPIDPLEPGATVQLAWAIDTDVVVIALGPSFVRSVLDVDGSTSLASDARYRALLDSVGSDNAGSTFVDLGALRVIAEGFLTSADAESAADYAANMKPYLQPFDAWIQVMTVGAEIDRAIMRIAVE